MASATSRGQQLLEDRVRASIRKAFPWLEDSDIEPIMRLMQNLNAAAHGRPMKAA